MTGQGDDENIKAVSEQKYNSSWRDPQIFLFLSKLYCHTLISYAPFYEQSPLPFTSHPAFIIEHHSAFLLIL